MLELTARRWRRRQTIASILSALTVSLVGPTPVAAEPTPVVQAQDVHVERSGDTFTVDLVLHVPVSPARAWAVLTDFERQKDFIPNVSTSEVSERHGNQVKLTQKGTAHFGIFSKDFESVREVLMIPPTEIRSHGVGGNIEHVESMLHLEGEGTGTRVTYHTEVQTGFWLPPVLGPAAVRQQTAEQFNAIVAEMLKLP